MKLFALANEKNDTKDRVIRVPYGTWDYGTKKLEDGRSIFFTQTLDRRGAQAIAGEVSAKIAKNEKGVPVYWGHPDVPELAHKYPDKRAKGWIVKAEATDDALLLTVDWLDEKPTEGFGWFSPFWKGSITPTGEGRASMAVDSIQSVALINTPNIEEFRLANELQDTDNPADIGHKEKEQDMDRNKLIQMLGLKPEATDEEIFAAIGKLKTDAADASTKLEAANAETETAKKECKEAKDALANERNERCNLLLDSAIADGRISVAGRAAWAKRLTEDFAAGSVALANEKPLKRESAVKELANTSGKSVDLVALANERMQKNPGMSYTVAFAAVMKEHPEVK